MTVADLNPDTVATDLGATALRLDVRDEAQVAQAMNGVEVLVNAAGIGSTSDAPGTSLEVWEKSSRSTRAARSSAASTRSPG